MNCSIANRYSIYLCSRPPPINLSTFDLRENCQPSGIEVPYQVNMQPNCKSNYDNAYEIAQRSQKQLKREQYVAGVVSGDNNELYQQFIK